MSNTDFLKGTGVALVTPFRKDKDIDFEALTRLVTHVIQGGVEYLVVMGTTGESVVLSPEEKIRVLEHIREVNAGRLPIVLGMGGNHTASLVDQIKEQDFEGVQAVLSVCPYYNKPNQAGLYAHFAEIAENCPLPVILYNVPGRTGSRLTPETTLRLAFDYQHIVATKEASGQFEAIMAILDGKPDHFAVVSGDDGLTLPLMSAGVEGVISVIANATPFEMSEMVRLANAGRFTEARKLHYRLLRLFSELFEEGNPAGVKASLHHLGIIQNELRLPLVPVSSALYERISGSMNRLRAER